MIQFNTSKYFVFAGILLINFMQMSHHSINGDCVMESKYCVNGLNTEKNSKCVAWKNYGKKYEKLFENTTLCKKHTSYYWCATKGGTDWSYCRPSKCNLPDIICNIDQFWTVNRKSIKLNFQKVSENFDLIIIISSNPTFSKCSITSKCNQCQSTENLMNNLFGSCNSANIRRTDINTIVVELPEFSDYKIYILPVSEEQLHGSLYKLSITTSEKVPAAPYDIQLINIEISSMIIQWKSPEETNEFGPSSGYFLKLVSPFHRNYKLQETNKSMTNLKPCTKYCFEIISFNIAGNSAPSEIYCPNTKPVFDNISSLSSTRNSDVSVMIKWNYFNKKNCNVTFLIKYFNKFQENDILSIETTNQNILLQDLSINRFYIVNVCPIIDDVKGQISNNLEFHTIHVPKPPNNIRSIFQTKNSITLQWDQIKLEDSNIKHSYKYEIKQNGVFQLKTNESQSTIYDLLLCTKYCFTISSSNIAGKSNESETFCAFTKTVPIEIKVLPLEYDKSNSTIIRWQYNNIIKCSLKFKIEYLMKPNIPQKSNEMTNNNYLGISSIEFNQILSIKIIPVIENEIEEFSVNINLHTAIKSKSKIIYLIYLFLALLLLATSSYVIYRKEDILRILNRPKKSEVDLKFINNADLKTDKIVKPKQSHLKLELPTKLSKKNFKDLCNKARLYEESHELSTNCGELLENKSKNRFANILPYDQTRVRLKRSPPQNDYINANYIPFVQYNNKHEYIASQGPINDTISDFWQMIWENNVSIIVMLTRTYEEEKLKCLQYWPEDIHQKIEFGENKEFLVTIVDETEAGVFVERKLNILNKIENKNRIIIHLHMMEWLDYAAPKLKDFESLIFRFQEIVLVGKFDPYLIHCSAGVGRTGTFIVLDRIIRKLMEGNVNINVSEEILEIRKYRKMMVQRASQFNFINDFLEYFVETYKRNTFTDQEDLIYFNVS